MQLGMVGLGRMGSNMVRRLVEAGHSCVVFDVDDKAVARLEGAGVTGSSSIEEFVGRLDQPRVVWLMLPAGIVGQMVDRIGPFLQPGDVLVDGGNSYYRDAIWRAAALAEHRVSFLDVGTSGGVRGLERGYCLMIGGEPEPVALLDPVFRALAPGVDAAPRTAGRDGEPTAAELGYLHCGPPGAGHFVKMVHNGIEYGLMAAYAEGLNILAHAGIGREDQEVDAETAPLLHPEHYQYEFELVEVAEVWRRGSVVASWLLDLTANALAEDPDLSGFSGRVSDSGEGRWTAIAAVEEGVPAPVITAALQTRFQSRGADEVADKLLSALRHQFGGHAERQIK